MVTNIQAARENAPFPGRRTGTCGGTGQNKRFLGVPVKLSPVFFAFLGAGGIFYAPEWGGLGAAVPFLAVLGLGLLCALRVLNTSLPFLAADPRWKKRFRGAGIYCHALGLGVLLGVAFRFAAPQEQRPGLLETRIEGLAGVLRQDLRGLRNGGAVGYIELEEARGWTPGSLMPGAGGSGPVRASAKGIMPVFFPPDSLPRLAAFGRRARVYIEGKVERSPAFGETAFRARGVHILKGAPALEQLRTGLRNSLIERLSPHDWGSLALALLLGYRDALDVDLAEAYRRAGCSHILALSGMHLALIAGMVALGLKKPLGLRFAALAGGIALLPYAFLVGPQPSLVRGLVMYILGLIGIWGKFPRNSLSLLGLAFIIQLALDPASGKTPSFLLSYAGLGGLLLLRRPVENLLRGRLPALVLKPLAASLGAFLGTAGISAGFFGVLYPIGIAAGLIAVPLTFLFMILTMAGIPLAAIPGAAAPVDTLLSLCYALLKGTVGLAAMVPGIPADRPLLWGILTAFLSFLLFAWGNWYGIWRNRLAPFAAA
ncbi:MAG: ComEC/Rec2 family competence protein [Treponema sp.]|jgi:competence protein ComEC|nr:ComEC/Rec2 family competence protein [Treponema sp.]